MTKRIVLTAGVVLATTFAGVASADDARRFTLEWSAPPGCPNIDAVRASVEKLLGPPTAPRIQHLVAANGSVTETNGQAKLSLETTEDGLHGRRLIDGATCDEVTAAGALIVALAVDPDAVREHASSSATGAFTADGPGPAPARLVAPCPPTVVIAPPPPVPAGSSSPAVVQTAETRRAAGLLETRAIMDVGSLPAPSFGAGLGTGFAIRRFRVRLGATYLLPRFGQATAVAGTAGADVSLLLGDLAGCYVLAPGMVEANVCVGFEAGALTAVGRGFAVTRSALEPWLAGTGGFEVATLALDPLALRLNLGAAVPLGRSPVQFHEDNGNSSPTFARPGALALRVGVGVGLMFW